MKLIIDIDDSDYERIKDLVSNDTKYTSATTVGTAYQVIANGLPYERPQVKLANEVWKLYRKHQSHLATHVLEFGDELKELLCKYLKGDVENG